MPTNFARSLRSLEADAPAAWALKLGLGFVIVGAWVAWAVLARVSVYAQSASARLEVEHSARPIEPAVVGRVLRNQLVLGEEVREGEVLVELDASTERLRLAEATAHLAGLGPQLAARRRELAAENDSSRAGSQRDLLALAEARTRAEEADITAAHAEDLLERSRALYGKGGTAESELLNAQAAAQGLRLASRALRLGAERSVEDKRTSDGQRRVRVERVENEIAILMADLLATTATIQRLENEIALHTVRAAVTGRVAEAAPVQPGTTVREGQRLGAILPAGDVRLVADFVPAEALGRVRAGQRARLRLTGFPWTQYGLIGATVHRVSGELRDGFVRVELAVNASGAGMPLEHGLPGTVEIEIEQAAPAALVLRAAGNLVEFRGSR